ncbi:MAG: prephenate dehydrogenase, partial [Chloroflexota bacterium]|nr:prephenate dehydrogenase [Chloroflexota bacterium]
TGFDLDIEQQQYAQRIKAIDRGSWDLAKAVQSADIVILATPVAAMRETFETIAPHLKAGATVIDTGSTKTDVVAWADALLPREVAFVGGHPMAGKSQSIEGADADLFKGATWVVTPSVRANDDAIRNALGLVAAVGAEPFFVDPVEHDAYVAGISHLPLIVSTALVQTVTKDASWRDMKSLTAGGFRDVSRLAAGSPEMHRDILLTNRAAITRWIDSYVETLTQLRAALQKADDAARPALTDFFTEARDARADWSTQTTREGELLQGTASELSTEGLGDQMGRMLLGGLAKRRRGISSRDRRDRATAGRDDERSPR